LGKVGFTDCSSTVACLITTETCAQMKGYIQINKLLKNHLIKKSMIANVASLMLVN